MTTKTKAPRRDASRKSGPPLDAVPPAPITAENREQLLLALGERISGHIRFMCQVGSLPGVSTEAKDRAVTAFHERLSALEKELGRISEILQLE